MRSDLELYILKTCEKNRIDYKFEEIDEIRYFTFQSLDIDIYSDQSAELRIYDPRDDTLRLSIFEPQNGNILQIYEVLDAYIEGRLYVYKLTKNNGIAVIKSNEGVRLLSEDDRPYLNDINDNKGDFTLLEARKSIDLHK